MRGGGNICIKNKREGCEKIDKKDETEGYEKVTRKDERMKK